MDAGTLHRVIATAHEPLWSPEGLLAGCLLCTGCTLIALSIVESRTGWTFRTPPPVVQPGHEVAMGGFVMIYGGILLTMGGVAHACHGHGGMLLVLYSVLLAMVVGWIGALLLRRLARRRQGML